MAAITISNLVRPTCGAIILLGLPTAVGAVLNIVPSVTLTQMAAIRLGKGKHKDWAANPWSWAAVAIVALLAYQLPYLMSLGVTYLAEAKLRHQLRGFLVETFSRLPLDKVAQIPHGAIRKTACDDTATIHTLVAHVPGDVTNALVSVAVGTVYLFWTDWRLALALIGLWVLIIVVIAVTTMRGLGDITSRFGEAQIGLVATTVEILEGIKEIKNFQTIDAARTRFNTTRHRFSDLSYQWVSQSGKSVSLLGALLHPATMFATVTVLTVVFASQGWTELSATLSFSLLAPGLSDNLSVLISLAQYICESRMAAQSITDLLSEEPMPQDTFDQGGGNAPGCIEVNGMIFFYEPNTPVLRGVSFTTKPGTVTAFVGPSGGGKSTLARLVARFHGTGRGTVKIGGVDVWEMTFAWLLSQVAIMLQDVALTNDSVFNNIVLRRPGVTREQVETAAHAACVHGRVMHPPKGYDTIPGEKGRFLFGSERRHVTLARAYLQGAPILVLDEAIAQADPQSGRDIHQALTRLTKGRTVIIIAHRLTTTHDADQILVLGDGQVVRRGRHDDLVAASGRYAIMWRSQDPALSAAAAREE